MCESLEVEGVGFLWSNAGLKPVLLFDDTVEIPSSRRANFVPRVINSRERALRILWVYMMLHSGCAHL
jgi:hypothetical protein